MPDGFRLTLAADLQEVARANTAFADFAATRGLSVHLRRGL